MSKVETFNELIGHTFIAVDRGATRSDDTLTFCRDDGRVFRFMHRQDCCEYVRIEDICGDLSDLVQSPILVAESVTHLSDDADASEFAPKGVPLDCWTWTFYKFSTIKGSVTVRWLGESNGYYSESVDFFEVEQ